MKRLNIILIALVAVLFSCCNSDDLAISNTGYLTINVSTVNSTNIIGSRAVPADYNALQLAIEIINQSGETVKSTDDASIWAGEDIALPAGVYTVNVHSNNWDGNDSGRDVPFYAGSKEVEIANNTKSEATIVCTLANVKVSVDFDESVADKFASAYVEVSSAVAGILPQTFTMGDVNTLKSAYFPVGDLTATLHVTNKAGVEYTKVTQLEGVKARDHYKLHYSVEASGNGEFTVSASDNETTYTYNLYVPGDPNISFNTTTTVNEWATFAQLEGAITSTSLPEVDDNKVMFLVKAASDEEWTKVAATKAGDAYKATTSDLTPGTAYNCQLAYVDGENVISGTTESFTTEAATQLPNSGFEDWYKRSNLWYPCSEADFNNLFWGCSNVNAVITQINGVTGTSDCHSGTNAASLQSKYVSIVGMKKFAAGSIFSGGMPEVKGTSGAAIEFGREFTTRPSQLTGYFKYSTAAIDQVGKYALPDGANVVKGTTPDLWSAYIALMTEKFTLDNSTEDKLKASVKDFKSGTDPTILAYGEVPDALCVEAGDWTKFTIDLTYFDTTTKPSYIVVVFSSSKYGDYFTGYSNSLLLLDDIELVYGQPSL